LTETGGGIHAVEEALSDLEEELEPPPRLAEGVSEATALVQELQDSQRP
jgi:hypothetical protein